MKKFIAVYHNDGEYGSKGDFKKGIEAESVDNAYQLHGSDMGRRNTVTYLEVAEELDERKLKPELIPAKEAHWAKDGFEDVFVDPEDESWTPVAATSEHYELVENAEMVTAALTEDATQAITEKYMEMDADVYAQMEVVFGTKKSDSATAFYETWKQMSAKPELFSPEDLTAEKEIIAADGQTVLFAEGDALDTDTKITTYANRLLEIADLYSVFRMKRIKQFRDEKAAILAS